MPRINILSGEVFKKKFANYMAVGLTGLAIGLTGLGIVKGAPKMLQNHEFNHKAAYVQKAIDSMDFELAENLLDKYRGNKSLRLEDEVKFSTILKRENKKILEAKNFKEAQKANNSTEAGLFEKIKYSDLSGLDPYETAESSCKEYLRLYPQGANRRKVIENLLIYEFGALDAGFSRLDDFRKNYARIIDLNELLEKYSREHIKLDDVVPMESILSNCDNYLECAEEANLDDAGQTSAQAIARINELGKIIYAYRDSLISSSLKVTIKRLLKRVDDATNEIIVAKQSLSDNFPLSNELELKKIILVNGDSLGSYRNKKIVKRAKKRMDDAVDNLISLKSGQAKTSQIIKTDEIQKNLYRREIRKLDDSFSKYYHGGK